MSPIETMKSNSWLSNMIIGVLFGALVTTSIGVISFGGRLPTRDEVENIVATQSPYTLAKSGIDIRLKNIEAVLCEIKSELREQRKEK